MSKKDCSKEIKEVKKDIGKKVAERVQEKDTEIEEVQEDLEECQETSDNLIKSDSEERLEGSGGLDLDWGMVFTFLR